jgi:hypothetical protein
VKRAIRTNFKAVAVVLFCLSPERIELMQRARPVMRTRSPMMMSRRRRRWDRVSWWWSSIFVVAILLLGWKLLSGGGGSDFRVKVFDASTGKAIAGAFVHAGQNVGETDGDGVAKLKVPAPNTVITVSYDGYAPVYGNFESGFSTTQNVSLRPLNAVPDGSAQTAQVAPTATTAPEQSAPAPTTAPPTAAATQPSSVSTGAVSGTVIDENGKPLKGALIRADTTITHTDKTGAFELDSAPSGKIVVSQSGYKDQTVDAGQNLSVKMARQSIEAAYLNGELADDEDTVNRVIDLIDRTELNAVVIDIKENSVYYDTHVKFFVDAGVVHPTYDAAALVKKFHDHGIYVIARQVVFKDPLIAAHYPELAVKDDNGGLWYGTAGEAWVNPFQKGLWQPNIDMALEAAHLGFDEIQFDYIRFPSDGDLSTADFGPDYSEDGRVGAIVSFLKMAHEQLEPTGAKLAVDVFGIVAVYPDDQGIGQRLVDIAPVVDYMCPMVYPSHFDPTSIDVGGEPNDHPYETVSLALGLLAKRIPDMQLKIRPWLQDFTLGGMMAYGPEQVDDQIKAAEEVSSGWMLWNEGSEFTEDALKQDDGPNT